MNAELSHLLMAKGFRSGTRNKLVAERIFDQQTFDELFSFLFHHERTLVIRTADAIENIGKTYPQFLTPHKEQLIRLLTSPDHVELKGHIAQLLPRLDFTGEELKHIWNTLSYWVQNPNEAKTVRINALQCLHDLSRSYPSAREAFLSLYTKLSSEHPPSLQARLKKLGVILKTA